MKTRTCKLLGILLLCTVLQLSCTSISKKENADSKTIAEKVISNQDIKPEIEKILYEFPTPFEVTLMLNNAKASFIFDLTNPVENAEKYMTEKKQALNLGVYSADLSYAAAYNRSDEMVKLMECTSKLCDELGISGIYNQNLLEIVKENASNQDSLVKILTNVFDETKKYLSKSDRDQVTLLIASGGFIESLYLTANLNVLAGNNSEIASILFSQKENLDNLFNLMDAFSYDNEIESLKTELLAVKDFYASNALMENKTITDEKSEELKSILEKIRDGIVK